MPCTIWNRPLELWEVTFSTDGFSSFFITGQTDSALPVTLSGFTVSAKEQSVSLQWQISEEWNTQRFEIQRSADTRQWQSVGEVVAAGKSDAPLAYRHSDLRPLSGLSYYRLKMIDFDGTYAYSEIRSVISAFVPQRDLEVYPNPASDRIYLNTSGTVSEVLLWDIAGHLLHKGRYDHRRGIMLINLRPGILLVEVRYTDGTVKTTKVITTR